MDNIFGILMKYNVGKTRGLMAGDSGACCAAVLNREVFIA